MPEFATCPLRENALEVGTAARWPINKLTWRNVNVRYPDFNFRNGMDYVSEMLKKHQVNLFLNIVEDNRGANLESRMMTLNESDGPGGTLAFARLPDQWTTANTTLPSVFDGAERPDQIQGEVTQAHELNHNWGLRHFSGQPDLMNPRLNTKQHNDWGDWTEMTLRSLYGTRGGPQEPTCAVFKICQEACPEWVPTMRRIMVRLSRGT